MIAPFFERLLLALFATVPAALVGTWLFNLAPPPGLPALAQRPLWLVWLLLAAWLCAALALALVCRSQLKLWRWGLGALAVALLAVAATGAAVGPAVGLAGWVAAAAMLLAALCCWLARWIGPARVRGERAARAAASDQRASPPRGPIAWWQRAAAALPFWITAAAMVDHFRLAFVVATEPVRSVGMLGMLLVFFFMLPAVSLAPWLPQTAGLLLALAALGFAGLAWKSSVVSCVVCAAAAIGLLAAVQLQHRHGSRQQDGAADSAADAGVADELAA